MLLVFLVVALAAAQSSLGEAFDARATLTKQQAPNFISQPTLNEQQFVFTSTSSGVGTKLFSTSTGSVNPNQQVLLSQPEFAFGQGAVGSNVVSPDESYVLFDARVQTNNVNAPTDQFSVGINGGGITRITPPLTAGATSSVSSYSFRGCAGTGCSGSDASIFWALVPTAVASNAVINEIWTNNRAGNSKRINVPLLQAPGLRQTKFLTVQFSWPDFFLYQANPGVDQEFNSRRYFLADWTGANWLVSPINNFATFDNSTATNSALDIRRSYTPCNPNGRYIAIQDNIVTNSYKSIIVYDTQEKRLLNGGLPVNPLFDANSTTTFFGWTPDQKKFFYLANPSGTLVKSIYEFDVSTATSRVISSNPFAASGNTTTYTPIGTGVRVVGDYWLWTVQTVAGTDSQVALFSYNWNTGAAATQLYITPNGGMNPDIRITWVLDVAGARSLGGPNGNDALWSNTANIFFTSDNAKQLWVVPVAGGAATRLFNDPLNTFPNGVTPETCGAPLDTNFCKLSTTGCTCTSCSGSRRCGSFTWVVVTFNGTVSTHLHAVNYNGQSISQATPAGGRWVNNAARVLPVPNSNNDVPTIFFRARTGAETPTDNTTVNLYSQTPGSATVTINSQAPVQNWQGGNVQDVRFAPTNSYVAFQVNSDPLFPTKFEQYVVPFAGGTNVKVSPGLTFGTGTTGGFARQSVSTARWSPSGKYLVFVIDDNNSVLREQRGQLWAYQPGANLPAQNLTVSSNATDVNSIPNGFTNFRFHCNQETLLYQTNLPEANTASGVFSVPLKGGQTVALGFNPTTGGAVSTWGVFRASFRVWYTSNNFFGTNNDLFVNTASAAFLLPSIALLLLALFL